MSEVQVDGVTLSTEQLATAIEKARTKGLSDRARFFLADYRDLAGPYDRIVSVGMFEHVGRPNFQTFFEQVARLLDDDGVAVIHSIGRPKGPGFTQPWIAKHIFPGSYIPALSEMTDAAERAGLIVTDVEVLRLHYAETLRCWRERFQACRAEIVHLYDERFCRRWEFYLCISETAFRRYGHSVFQLQLAKRIDAVPITRDYIAVAEIEPNVAVGGSAPGTPPRGFGGYRPRLLSPRPEQAERGVNNPSLLGMASSSVPRRRCPISLT
jgi:cyclopropane-fatty-acyl-phospholipid synthase